MKLPLSFYQTKDVEKIAKDLLGKFLYTKINNNLTGGMIIETEAYGGIYDKASHAYNNRYTKRTSTMYEKGGISYIYLCYGIHYLFNIVTNKKNIPEAVLIRALIPTIGIKKGSINLTSGPALLTKALKIDKKLNGIFLNSNIIWLEDKKIKIKKEMISITKRIGIDYAEEDADRPWRFFIKKPFIKNLLLNNINKKHKRYP
ncbi:MAG: hypothetical protein AMS24_01405 [Chlamydiae bacterium SM23_39]|nr:MAG: hypothetical protein AMS24_01405 [Chlamydiae bacterium SM23_39]